MILFDNKIKKKMIKKKIKRMRTKLDIKINKIKSWGIKLKNKKT
jgi:hypothetical protein